MTAKIKAYELFIKYNGDASEAASQVRQKISRGWILWEDLQIQTTRFWEEVIQEIYKLRKS